MAFWINIYGCQPYPRYGPLKVNQLKNDSFRQALYQTSKVFLIIGRLENIVALANTVRTKTYKSPHKNTHYYITLVAESILAHGLSYLRADSADLSGLAEFESFLEFFLFLLIRNVQICYRVNLSCLFILVEIMMVFKLFK